jgi:hypothetical protein
LVAVVLRKNKAKGAEQAFLAGAVGDGTKRKINVTGRVLVQAISQKKALGVGDGKKPQLCLCRVEKRNHTLK